MLSVMKDKTTCPTTKAKQLSRESRREDAIMSWMILIPLIIVWGMWAAVGIGLGLAYLHWFVLDIIISRVVADVICFSVMEVKTAYSTTKAKQL